jgi:hypothetical protein
MSNQIFLPPLGTPYGKLPYNAGIKLYKIQTKCLNKPVERRIRMHFLHAP